MTCSILEKLTIYKLLHNCEVGNMLSMHLDQLILSLLCENNLNQTKPKSKIFESGIKCF